MTDRPTYTGITRRTDETIELDFFRPGRVIIKLTKQGGGKACLVVQADEYTIIRCPKLASRKALPLADGSRPRKTG